MKTILTAIISLIFCIPYAIGCDLQTDIKTSKKILKQYGIETTATFSTENVEGMNYNVEKDEIHIDPLGYYLTCDKYKSNIRILIHEQLHSWIVRKNVSNLHCYEQSTEYTAIRIVFGWYKLRYNMNELPFTYTVIDLVEKYKKTKLKDIINLYKTTDCFPV